MNCFLIFSDFGSLLHCHLGGGEVGGGTFRFWFGKDWLRGMVDILAAGAVVVILSAGSDHKSLN